ncbi:MAG: response regulator [Desulfobacteraceae bacterium]|nr:response regulator [Desulfobacteraceae bacterium]
MNELKDSNVHILLVEDNSRFLERLEKRLKKVGYQQLKSARNAADARKELNESHFDVIVADMRLEKDNSGGFEVIDIVKELKLSSIVIIFTANDTVADCRKALKGKGAWDYISKTMDYTDPMEELHKSIQEALTYFNQWGNVQDKAWIKDNMGYLLDNYHGNYVAVLNNKVIEAATDKADLEKQIIDKKLPLFLTVIEKIDDELFKQLSAKLIVFFNYARMDTFDLIPFADLFDGASELTVDTHLSADGWVLDYSKLTITGDGAAPAVPEPGTMFLLGFGLVGLAVFGRRKKILRNK